MSYFHPYLQEQIAELREQDSAHVVPKSRGDFCKRYPPSEEDGDVETMGRYGVGMVMKHRRYNYRCVIFGWDTHCVAERVSLLFKIHTFFRM